jgi:hypothetical protein
VLRDYAPVPGTLIPGRAAALRVVEWREASLLFTTGETSVKQLQSRKTTSRIASERCSVLLNTSCHSSRMTVA